MIHTGICDIDNGNVLHGAMRPGIAVDFMTRDFKQAFAFEVPTSLYQSRNMLFY